VGPSLNSEKRVISSGRDIENVTSTHTEERGIEIDDSSPRAGAFRVWGGSLRLTRGFHMILETQSDNR